MTRVVRSSASYDGETVALQCGGTLVFDDRGNLLSWFHKPGTEHITSMRRRRCARRLSPHSRTGLSWQTWKKVNGAGTPCWNTPRVRSGAA